MMVVPELLGVQVPLVPLEQQELPVQHLLEVLTQQLGL